MGGAFRKKKQTRKNEKLLRVTATHSVVCVYFLDVSETSAPRNGRSLGAAGSEILF